MTKIGEYLTKGFTDLLEKLYSSPNPKTRWYTQRNPVATKPPLDPEIKERIARSEPSLDALL